MKLIFYIVLVAFSFSVSAQNDATVERSNYPQDYFRNPLNIPIFLAGNFGECRPGHFHSGIDIKTLGKENQPVHAAADGYISRIKMEKGGFGHALYITHPNGYTTLYAHLNKFVPNIQKYVRQEQYKKKRWDVDIDLSPTDFPVKKGQQIAWSGNTGASTAPHLHFEIRNTKTEHPLNPELFGLPIVDNLPPVPTEVVFYDNEFNSFYYCEKETMSVVKKTDEYVPEKMPHDVHNLFSLNGDTVFLPMGRIGIGINVNDYMDGSDNTLAFYTAKLFMDDTLQSQVTLDNIGYDETRYINAYVDYGTRQEAHKWIQCFFQLPGNRLEIYSSLNKSNGWLDFPVRHLQTLIVDGKMQRMVVPELRTHKIAIVITDDKGNESKITFHAVPANYDNPSDGPSMAGGYTSFYANKPNSFKNDYISFSLDERQLYDDILFRYAAKKRDSAYSDEHCLLNPDVPIHHYFDLVIKPNKQIPAELKNKIAMIYNDGKDEDGRGALATDDGWYKAKVRNFGTYWLDVDTIPPVITSMQKNGSNLSKAKQITFEVKDATTSVRSFSGYLDGKWICFESHADQYFYEFDEHCPKGKHELVFKATDENDNTQTFKLTFTR